MKSRRLHTPMATGGPPSDAHNLPREGTGVEQAPEARGAAGSALCRDALATRRRGPRVPLLGPFVLVLHSKSDCKWRRALLKALPAGRRSPPTRQVPRTATWASQGLGASGGTHWRQALRGGLYPHRRLTPAARGGEMGGLATPAHATVAHAKRDRRANRASAYLGLLSAREAVASPATRAAFQRIPHARRSARTNVPPHLMAR